MGFKLKGNTNSTTRNVRTLKEKVRALELRINEGHSVKDALRIAAEENRTKVVPAMVNRAHSIYNGYRVTINKKIENKDAETLELLQAAGLVEETPDEVEESTEQPTEEMTEEELSEEDYIEPPSPLPSD